MLNIISKASPQTMATKIFTPTLLRPVLTCSPVTMLEDHMPPPPKPVPMTSHSLAGTLPKTNLLVGLSATYSLGSGSQVRFAHTAVDASEGMSRIVHTDLKAPDFSHLRRNSCKDPSSNSRETSVGRKTFSYATIATAGVIATYFGKSLTLGIVNYVNITGDFAAMAKIEVDLSVIPEGKSVVVKWQGKPLFIRHRGANEIATEKAVDLSSLRHNQHDDERVKNDQWLIVIGICTHLGCVPILDAGDFGGYYCPCHGSHYDGSGRIRKGPAPMNLHVPPYEFAGDTTVVVG